MARTTTIEQDRRAANFMRELLDFSVGAPDATQLLQWIAQNYPPQAVYPHQVLAHWAVQNGYVPEGTLSLGRFVPPGSSVSEEDRVLHLILKGLEMVTEMEAPQ